MRARLAVLALAVAAVAAVALTPSAPSATATPAPTATAPRATATATAAPTATATAAPSPAARKALAVRLDLWRYQAGAPPAGWTEPAFDDRPWGGPAAGPFAPRALSLAAPQSGVTLYDFVSGAPLLLRSRFSVADPGRARVLELRVGYADGFIAYVNGREVARRGLIGLTAAVPHGPEVEHVYVPVGSPALPSLRAEGNVIALAVYAYPGRSAIVPTAPAATVDVAAASGVRIVRGPYLVAPVEGKEGAGLSVVWETDLPATGAVTVERVGAKPAEPPRRIAVRGPAATRQVVRLGALVPGARYQYRVEVAAAGADTAASEPARFETVAAPPAPVRFAVYGDMRYPGHDAHRAVVAALVREAPPLVFITGDLTDEGSQESNWQRFFEISAPIGAIAPIIPALGNHDAGRGGAGSVIAWSLFGVPASPPPGWWSMDLGGVHFVVLDTNDMRNPAQREWLTDDLARAQRRHPRAIFAFGHEGPWSHALHGGESRMVHDYAALLAAGHVDVLFSGHDHVYERGTGATPSGKLTYVVTGGGGAPLYNPTCRAATGPAPGDVPGPLPPCPSSVAVLTKAYHYVVVEVTGDGILLCPRRPDGSPVEPCVHLPPHPRGGTGVR